jgi:gas vesicle protein
MLGLIGGAAVGAAAMFLLDPEKGRQRRAAALDAANRALETATDAAGTAYDSTAHALHDAWDRVSHHATDLSSAAAESIPSTRAARKTGKRWLRRGNEYAGGALDTVRGYLPHVHLAKDHRQGISPTTTGLTAAGALALGLGAMFLLDPARGRGRRAWIMQKANRALNETGDFMRATGRHLRNKAVGYAHETRNMLPIGGGPESDETIDNRVRSELGRTGVAGSVGVRCEGGCITLTGRCTADDVDRILSTVRGVRGVSTIENQLNIADRYPGAATTNPSTSNISA